MTTTLDMRLTDEQMDRISMMAVRMLESLLFYSEDKDAMMHLSDAHEQFQAIAKEMGYSVRREK